MASAFNNSASLREKIVALPDKPVSMPYDMRSEVTWIDFSNRSNPLGTPKQLIQELHTALVDAEHTYIPDRDGRAFRHAAASYHAISPERILLGTSSTQLITYAACAFDYVTVGICEPCPLSYEIAVGNAGHHILPIHNPVSFAPANAPDAFVQGEFQGLVVGNPTYPSSRLIQRQSLIYYLEHCEWVIVDESNIELTIGGESMIDLIDAYPNLIIIRSASASYGMPGIPISYLVAHESMVAHIGQFYAGTDIGMFGEVLALQLFVQKSFMEETHAFLDNEIPWLQCMLNLVPGIKIFPAEGNYVLCEFNPASGMKLGIRNASELVSSLELVGFLIDDLHDTPGLPHDNFFCVSVRTRAENERLLAAMRSIIIGNE